MSMDNGQHKVYLGVPGRNVCWGTVTGVINSTVKHIAIPHNAGYGFSGVEDFNLLWTDAHNLQESGEVSHFAMLHGDITPDVMQRWLDILLEEMDRLDASVVSAISPIKDPRGVTSCGICDLADPWKPFRRFTIRELQRMPETFNNVEAGYPDRPLLHNTGLWVCDLRKPEFHATKPDGTLALYFEFPTEAVRNGDKKWEHRRESEDWHFSRSLWHRGVRNTYITRKVRLRHHGDSVWTNYGDWGNYPDGDEDTANKWRPELENKPLRMLQMLQFELGAKCNLGHEHKSCPNLHAARFANLDTRAELDDEMIVCCAVEAYNDLGFSGLIGWAYYNEPLLQAERMFGLMKRIKARVSQARFILWTNGTLIPQDCDDYRQFSQIVISAYKESSKQGVKRLTAKSINADVITDPEFDTRLHRVSAENPSAPCLRPFVELVIDAYGNTHFCCYDWRGEGTFGNVFTTPIAELAQRWRQQIIPTIAGREMSEAAPQVCRDCGRRWDKYQQHDEGIVARARRWRDSLPALDPGEAEAVIA